MGNAKQQRGAEPLCFGLPCDPSAQGPTFIQQHGEHVGDRVGPILYHTERFHAHYEELKNKVPEAAPPPDPHDLRTGTSNLGAPLLERFWSTSRPEILST
jgi:hypothetical protein